MEEKEKPKVEFATKVLASFFEIELCKPIREQLRPENIKVVPCEPIRQGVSLDEILRRTICLPMFICRPDIICGPDVVCIPNVFSCHPFCNPHCRPIVEGPLRDFILSRPEILKALKEAPPEVKEWFRGICGPLAERV